MGKKTKQTVPWSEKVLSRVLENLENRGVCGACAHLGTSRVEGAGTAGPARPRASRCAQPPPLDALVAGVSVSRAPVAHTQVFIRRINAKLKRSQLFSAVSFLLFFLFFFFFWWVPVAGNWDENTWTFAPEISPATMSRKKTTNATMFQRKSHILEETPKKSCFWHSNSIFEQRIFTGWHQNSNTVQGNTMMLVHYFLFLYFMSKQNVSAIFTAFTSIFLLSNRNVTILTFHFLLSCSFCGEWNVTPKIFFSWIFIVFFFFLENWGSSSRLAEIHSAILGEWIQPGPHESMCCSPQRVRGLTMAWTLWIYGRHPRHYPLTTCHYRTMDRSTPAAAQPILTSHFCLWGCHKFVTVRSDISKGFLQKKSWMLKFCLV